MFLNGGFIKNLMGCLGGGGGARKLLAAVEAAGDGIGIIDRNGCLVYMNKALIELHGIAPADLPRYLGSRWENLYTEKGRAEILHTVMPVLKSKGFWRGESPIVRVGGDVAVAEMTLTLLEDGGFIGTARDVTQRVRERKEKDELHQQFLQAQKMESVGRLTGGVAHDFNNLLTVVSGNLDILHDILGDDPRTKKSTEAMHRAVTRGAELTRSLLAFARRQTLKPATVDLNAVIPETLKLIHRAMHDKIELRTRLDPALWRASADVGQLENALLNLAINARDAMPQGGTLTISTANNSSHAAGDYAVITVADTGTGIPPEIANRIFDPFFTTKEVGTGSGLGLSMVYGFMQQSSGFVTVESTPGAGAAFHLFFPRATKDTRGARHPVTADPLPRGTETVLLVEDEADILDVTRALLERLGYSVRTAANGPEGEKLLHELPACDLLLTDIAMPGGIDGLELAARAQTCFPGIRTLLVSGHMQDGGTLPSGAILLPKPYTNAQLAREVRRALAQGL